MFQRCVETTLVENDFETQHLTFLELQGFKIPRKILIYVVCWALALKNFTTLGGFLSYNPTREFQTHVEVVPDLKQNFKSDHPFKEDVSKF